jgi:hypothetical protein
MRAPMNLLGVVHKGLPPAGPAPGSKAAGTAMRAQASHIKCAQHVGVGGAVQRISAACPLAWTKRPRRQTRCPSPLPGRPAVEDLARSKKFYGEGLGCTIEQDYPNFVPSNLGDGSSSLALYER